MALLQDVSSQVRELRNIIDLVGGLPTFEQTPLRGEKLLNLLKSKGLQVSSGSDVSKFFKYYDPKDAKTGEFVSVFTPEKGPYTITMSTSNQGKQFNDLDDLIKHISSQQGVDRSGDNKEHYARRRASSTK